MQRYNRRARRWIMRELDRLGDQHRNLECAERPQPSQGRQTLPKPTAVAYHRTAS